MAPIFQKTFENAWISFMTSLKCVTTGQIYNIPALVVWPAPSHYVNQLWKVNWRISALLGFISSYNIDYVI